MLMPTAIKTEVEAVLRRAPVDDKGRRSHMTAYQILEQLSEATRNQLIQERGIPGAGSGNSYAAANAVSDAAEMITGIDVSILDTSDMNIMVKGVSIVPGARGVGIYKLP